jgi:hypothetical protein
MDEDIIMTVLMRRSGRQIIEILEKNPKKVPSKYDEDDLKHMRKVVAYCKRHLAQEGKAKQDPNSKSKYSSYSVVATRSSMTLTRIPRRQKSQELGP